MIAYVRVVDGELRKGDAILAMQTGTEADIDDIGFFAPGMTPVDSAARRRGRLRDHRASRTSRSCASATRSPRARTAAAEPLPGYREVKPMVFCGLFPVDTDEFADLRDALEKLALNDAALS